MTGRANHEFRGASKAAEHALFGVIPVLVTAFLLYEELVGRIVAVDFRYAYWVAGMRVLHGESPFLWTQAQIHAAEVFVYPAVAALLLAPFALLARGPAEALFTLICILSALGTLRVLSVRDWRLYGLVMLWPPVVAAWQTANLTLLLVLLLAIIWRERERSVVAGALSAVLVSLKPFTWPVLLWLAATRRSQALAWAVAIGVVINAVAWEVIGLGEAGRYLHLSSAVTDALYRTGYGAISLAIRLGADRTVATALEVVLATALALACAVAGRRGRDRESLTLCVAVMLAASPLVWNHYLALLLVPLSIARPRLVWIWALPLILWVCPSDGAAAWQVLLSWGVGAAVLGTILWYPGPPARHPSWRAARVRAVSRGAAGARL